LNTALGGIIHFIKYQKPHIPIAVLTNGTLFQDKKVRTELLEADLVMPSLDAATQEVFEKINRPEKSLHIEDYIQGLVDFRREFPGTINLEIFILPGYNDQESELIALQAAILKIKPDGVQLNTLDRPGTESGLQPATQEELMRIIDFWQLDNVQIIAKVKERKKAQAYRKDTATAILETIDRRPCTLEDLSEILGLHVNEINKYLSVLETEGKIESIPQQRGLFYQKKNR
nr:radical SAM protein [Candidatus Cloacimonadota bacterium]